MALKEDIGGGVEAQVSGEDGVDNRFLFECFLQASKNFLFFLVSCFVLFLLFGAEFQAKSTA